MKRRPDGRWQKKVTLADGTKKILYSSAATEKTAIKEFNEQLLSFKKDIETSTHFSRVAEEWSERAFPKLEHNTLKQYKPCLAAAVNFFKDMPIEKITAGHIQDYIDDLELKKYAGKTIKNRLLVLSLILDRPAMKGTIPFNPCKQITLSKTITKNKTKREKASDKDEQEIPKHTDSLFGILAYLYLVTGCRRGEAVALGPKDIDFDNLYIHIDKTVEWIGNKPKIKDAPKTEAGIRDIPIPKRLADLLKPYAKQNYIFSNEKGELFSNAYFTRHWDKYRNETGVSCTPHELRHSYATMLFDAGVDVKTAQLWLGHKDINTTLAIYTHLSKNKLEETTKKYRKYIEEKADIF